jgi:D-alanyl-D-alanine carboxypeptidase
MLIEKMTGKKYGEFLGARVFKPLGMTQTRVNDLQALIANRAPGYTWGGRTLKNGEYVSPTQPFAAGMLVSSVGDLMKWDAALRTETLLKKSSLEQMWTPARLSKGAEAGYGFGWGLKKVNGHRLISHGGGIPGFSTNVSRYVDDNFSVIVLTNLDSGNADALAQGIAGRLVPALAEQPKEPIADTDSSTTERLKRLIEGAIKGEIDSELFTKAAKEGLVSGMKSQKSAFIAFGALKKFQLYERKEIDQGLQLRYRAEFENETLNAFFDLDKAGKISGLGLLEVD